ncbi:MAG: 2Fe-2S iron-sulfur cluster-binding protein [Pseudomonadota bacterium]
MKITVTDRDGNTHDVETEAGIPLMEALRDLDYGVEAICGGMCSCATCHVYIAGDWPAQLPEPEADESDLLEALDHRKDESRLSCQVGLTETLEGLQVVIAPEE